MTLRKVTVPKLWMKDRLWYKQYCFLYDFVVEIDMDNYQESWWWFCSVLPLCGFFNYMLMMWKRYSIIKKNQMTQCYQYYLCSIFLQQYPGQRRTAGNGRFRGIPEISWKQYSGERIRWPDLSGFARNRQEPVKTGSRIRSPDSCVEFPALPGGFRPETGSFLRVFAGNSRNTASGIIHLGMYK